MNKIKIAIASLFIGSILFAFSGNASAYPPFLAKAKKFGAKDCTFCHIDPLGGPPWNERGKWLAKEKERRKADAVNVEWLAEYPGDAKPGAGQDKKEEKPAPGGAKKIDPKVFDAYVGDYQADIGLLHITKENDRLFGQPEGDSKKELLPETETKFRVVDVDAILVFVKDDTGKVTGLDIELNGQKFTAKKIK